MTRRTVRLLCTTVRQEKMPRGVEWTATLTRGNNAGPEDNAEWVDHRIVLQAGRLDVFEAGVEYDVTFDPVTARQPDDGREM